MPAGPEIASKRQGDVWLTTYLPIALALVPLLYLLHFCVALHVDVPFGDQWELVPRLQKLKAGTLSLDDVWRQHNEHRPMFPVLIMLGLAELTHWNIDAEIAFNIALAVGMFAIWWSVFGQWSRQALGTYWWLLPLVSLMVFSPQQWENWLWGWQIAIFLGAASVLAGLWLLSLPRASLWPFAAALVCGVVGTYSFASGLTYWVIGPVALALNPVHRGSRRPIAWLVVASATIGSYFINFSRALQPPIMTNFASLRAFAEFVSYIFKFLGAPVAAYSALASAVAGAAILGCFSLLLILNWEARRRHGFLFPAMVGLNVVADAVVTALGRAGFGANQAMASRYGTTAVQLWIAVLFLGIFSIAHGTRKYRVTLARPVFVSAAAMIGVSAVLAGRSAVPYAVARMGTLRPLRIEMKLATNWPVISQLYGPNTEELVRERVPVLQALKYSVFRK